jgi:predicted solute-binding protein
LNGAEMRGWRLGSVPYLNARPLIHGIGNGILLETPSRLAARFAAGHLDAALLPAYEALAGRRAVIVDDVAIACRGEVFSVFLAHREPLEAIESIALDPASRTSAHLLRCLLAEFYALTPACTDAVTHPGQARLIIGDPAIDFRRAHPDGDWQYLDLGAEWLRQTGLPFVFAFWVINAAAPDPERLAAGLRAVKHAGLAARESIAAASADPAFALTYLTGHIRYDLRDPEKAALRLFSRLLRAHGLADAAFEPELRCL